MASLNKDTAYRLGISYDTHVVDTNSGVVDESIRAIAISDSNFSHGFTNPGWKLQVKAGTNATTDLAVQRYTDSVTWASFSAHGKIPLGAPFIRTVDQEIYGSGLLYPVYASTVSVPSSVVTDVTNRCIRKFLDKANAATSSTNLTGRSIKHLKHDLHSLIHPMTSLRERISGYLTTLEKASVGRNLRSKPWLRIIRESYLEFSFGLKPFATDITDILIDMSRKRNDTVPISASSSRQFAGELVSFDYSSLGNFSLGRISGIRKVTSTYSVKMQGAIRTGTGSDGTIGIIQDNRLLPSDWLPTAFSIMPYAWMVNYFTNIGDIIDGLSFPSSRLAWGSHNVKFLNKVTYSDPTIQFNDLGNPSWFDRKVSGNGGNAVFTYETLTRDPLTPAFLIPQLELRIPTSVPKLLNMMAVFQPRISKLISRALS